MKRRRGGEQVAGKSIEPEGQLMVDPSIKGSDSSPRIPRGSVPTQPESKNEALNTYRGCPFPNCKVSGGGGEGGSSLSFSSFIEV